jgi:hypothetical protein
MFHWKGMKHDVHNFVQQCAIFQHAKHELCKYPELLQPLPTPQHSWTYISMDFIEGLPNSNGFLVILVVVDRFTKYNHFLPNKHPYTAPSIVQIFLDNVVKLNGIPMSLSVIVIKSSLAHFGLSYSSCCKLNSSSAQPIILK